MPVTLKLVGKRATPSPAAFKREEPVQEETVTSYTNMIQSGERSKPVLIIGKSGSGKSYSIRTLPTKSTFLINVIGKDLPFKGWRKNFVPWKKGRGGNLLCSDNYNEIDSALDEIKKRKDIKYVVIDDFQYLMANEFMRRSYEKGYDKWNEIGRHAWDILWKANVLGAGIIVFFLAHSDTNDLGETDVKTVGKMLSEKIVVAGLFTIVLQCVINKGAYYFETKSVTGKSVVKSPPEMFATDLVHNDLKAVADSIWRFENE